MKVRAFGRSFAVAGALALTALALAPPASADDETISTTGGSVVFQDHGEVISARDGYPDGLGVRANLLVNPYGETGGLHTATDDNGFGGDWVDNDLSVREGTLVWLQLCYTNTIGNEVQCSRWQSARA
jgi:hypothetical protein